MVSISFTIKVFPGSLGLSAGIRGLVDSAQRTRHTPTSWPVPEPPDLLRVLVKSVSSIPSQVALETDKVSVKVSHGEDAADKFGFGEEGGRGGANPNPKLVWGLGEEVSLSSSPPFFDFFFF